MLKPHTLKADGTISKFRESELAHKYLDGLIGVQIGGSAHNDFGLNCINVDYTNEITVYKKEEMRMCGTFLKVDVVADASHLPFTDKSYDFVINSHVLEHLHNPIAAVKEWERVAKKYIFIIVPRKDMTFDREKRETPISELIMRDHFSLIPSTAPLDDHWNIWHIDTFMDFCRHVCREFKMRIVAFEELDQKVGNGMTVLFEVNAGDDNITSPIK